MRILSALFILLCTIAVPAQLADCDPPISEAELDINNVRLLVTNGLQHFEDNGDAAYEVPKVGPGEISVNSIYADGLWIGGFSPDNQLHLAGVTYRSGGATDYYAGPLRTDGSGTTEADVCSSYDGVYMADRTEALLHQEYYTRLELVAGGADPAILTEFPFENGYVIPASFFDWPGTNPNADYSNYLAPFYDRDGDGTYSPENGDYPYFDLDGDFDCQDYAVSDPIPLLGHRAVWYVSNDAGLHTETGGAEMGLEVQVSTFQYAGCGAIDNTTFTRNLIINRSSTTYSDCSIGKWLDMDIGCAEDDYVGCDIGRGIAFGYNGDLNDAICAGVPGYGENLVAQGVKIFAGPHQDSDGLDNPLTADIELANAENGISYTGQGTGYGDGILDNERLGMRNFVFYNRNDQTGIPGINGEPNFPFEYYGMMNSLWKNGSHVSYGGNGVGGEIETDYMFPGDTDPLGVSTNGAVIDGDWSEVTEGNEPGDRRFVLSTGNFTMEPGEVNELIVGYIWAQDETGQTDAVDLLLAAADEVQSHFDNCFQFINDYPQLSEFDYVQDGSDVEFTFPMYAVENLTWDFGDGSSGSGYTTQHTYDAPGFYEVCVSHDLCGESQQICSTVYVSPGEFFPLVRITRTEGRGCGDHYIELLEEEIENMLTNDEYYEPELTYLINHGPIKIAVYDESLYQPGDYAIRLFGDDNNFEEDVEEWKLWKVGETDTIYSAQLLNELVDQYIPEYGLVVSIVQPTLVQPEYNNDIPQLLKASLSFSDSELDWLSGVPDTDDMTEQNWIRAGHNIGFGFCDAPEDPAVDCYYYDKANIDPDERFENVLGGTWSPWHLVAQSQLGPAYIDDNFQVPISTRMTHLNNIVLRHTSEKSKWTRSSIIETGFSPQLTEGMCEKLHPRIALSVDKNGLNQLEGGNYDECTINGTQVMTQEVLDDLDASEREQYKMSAFPGQDPSLIPDTDLIGLSFGMGWFPGYAVDVETGYRLNIMFGENSSFPFQNGRDMIWNPTADITTGNLETPVFGGGHYIYVLRNHIIDQASNSPIRMPGYDQGSFSFLNLDAGNTERKRVFRACTWVNMPVLTPGFELLTVEEGLIPSETTIRLAVSKEYRGQMYDTFDDETSRYPLYNFTVPGDIFSSVDEYESTPQFSIYPNPAIDQLTIQLLDETRVIEVVRILDLTGKEVVLASFPYDRSVDVSALRSGMYLIELEYQEGIKSVLPFVKQR